MNDASQSLANRQPALLDRLERVSPVEGERVIASLRNRSLNWESLIDRWVRGLQFKGGDAIALSGVGDGSHIIKLLDTIPKDAFLFCGELDVSVAKAFLESENASRLFSDDRFFFGAGELDDAFFESMERFPVLDVVNAEPLIFAPIYQLNEDGYSRFFVEFARRLEYWRKLFGTNVVSSGDWQGNTISNTKFLIGAPDLGEFEKAFEGLPLVLVSAGPSLDESLDFLKSVANRSAVVTVNSSYRAVRNAGIIPHFVLAADPFEDTAKGFDGVACDETILICPFIVCPTVVELFYPRMITWSADNLLASYLRLKLGLPLGTRVLEQGTVSACAFDLARIFGCTEMILVGQDLAVSPTGQSHATDSFYSDMNWNKANLDNCRPFPGNTLKTVLVEEKLLVYLKTFEQLVAECGSWLNVRNTSRLGAKIEGAPYQEFEAIQIALAESLENKLSDAYRDFHNKLKQSEARREAANEELKSLEAYTRKVCGLSLRLGISLETKGLDGKNDSQALEKALSSREELIGHLESHEDFHSILKDGALKYELLQYSREIRSSEIERDVVNQQINELKSYSWALAEGSFKLLSDLRSNIEDCADR